MTIPPFPSQDLAKLVLGYLAEEQLMTAYDEFLQASPYIDALRNEYDRIFMTSLKNILAEYRAVKIFVETCKPLPLRRKLVQCTNLVDQVKFLVNYADISKIQAQDTSSDKISYLKQNISASKQSFCDLCSLNVTNCLCKSKQKASVCTPHDETTNSSEKSVEATALEDLPGNHSTKKKHAKVPEKEVLLESNIGLNDSSKQSSNINNSSTGLNTVTSNLQSSQMKCNENSCLSAIVKISDTPECREKIEEFNSILNKVCNKKSKEDNQKFCVPSSEILHKSVSNASTFQEFASGVCGRDTRNVPVPDSSTSENSMAQTGIPSEINRNTCGHVNELTNGTLDNTVTRPYSTHPYPRIKPKSSNEQKIKIISDIKVDRPFTTLNNATSTPLMQTIVVNGTPAYKQKLPVGNNYTKDEIMAMPTIIVVPASGPPPNMTQTKPVLAQKVHQAKTKTVSSAQILSPLVLDVTSSNGATNIRVETKQPNIETQNTSNDVGLVKTVDNAKNASVPKDSIITCSLQTNTPQVLPPVRKSSSTPRRNSHIRVLDFTTPRRILHETINEIVPNEICDNHVEIDNKNTNLVISSIDNSENNIVDMRTVKVHKIDTCRISKKNSDADNKLLKFNKKTNWDADLRALTVMNDTSYLKVNNQPKSTKSASKIKKPKVKLAEPPVENEEETDKSKGKKTRSKRKLSPKVKKSKKLKKLQEEEAQYADSSNTVESKATVRPVFNIMGSDSYPQKEDKKDQSKEENNQNKSNNEDVNETPEAERLCLQNEIGARLNISEFLETPYKQVLYDIQMETPKFLGSVLPNDPISDIKIMSIPTPRFFDTPKPPHATPSSYSSRPTDYSSGGSYYKPDDQDYLRIPEIECPVTSSKDVSNVEIPEESDSSSKRSSRPVRKCTKNVSYVDRNNVDSNKTKEKVIEDKPNTVPNLSDSTSPNSSFENNKDLKIKTPKESKSKIHTKSNSKKKLDSVKKRKTPVKKDKLNSFMKIKPRRPTPTKENKKRTRRKTDVYAQSNTSKLKEKQPASVKEKNVHVTPATVPAPKKSRRKSSTPRKIHCTKTFTSESSLESPENNASASATVVYKDVKINVKAEQNLVSTLDSDTEQIALQWSDDASQDAKLNDCEPEDITKIKHYIETSANSKSDLNDKAEPLHVDLIKRGFDAETAKIIERDLLDAPLCEVQNRNACINVTELKNAANSLEIVAEKDTSATNELQIVQNDETEDDIELSSYECHEGSNNYLVYTSEAKEVSKKAPSKLKDKFCMEVCIDDGVAIRLRATSFSMLYDNTPANEEELGYSFRETEVAVSSISNIEKLYTPLKDHKAECFEIFDSTLTSLDTPLKLNSPKHIDQKVTEIEIVFEEEKVDVTEQMDTKKRKRLQGSMDDSEEALNESKKTKPEPQYLFNSTNIQNIDIESVLKKLHGP